MNQQTNVIESLLGKTLKSIEISDDKWTLTMFGNSGDKWVFECDECRCNDVDVRIDDIIGTIDSLIGSPILMAEECTSKGASHPYPLDAPEPYDGTWTFYKFATRKGYVTIRWFGTSNGFYSETVAIIHTCEKRSEV